MSHRAHLDVPAPTLRAVTAWIASARRDSGCRPWQRAATVHHHVLLVLRWMRHHAAVSDLAHDSHISIATAYRYLHEGLGVIAEHAPDLHEVLAGASDQGLAYLCLDGTLIPIDRVAQRTERGNNTWYSRQEPPVQRQHPGHLRPQRTPAVGLSGTARVGARPALRP